MVFAAGSSAFVAIRFSNTLQFRAFGVSGKNDTDDVDQPNLDKEVGSIENEKPKALLSRSYLF